MSAHSPPHELQEQDINQPRLRTTKAEYVWFCGDTIAKWEQCKQVCTPQFTQLVQQRRTWARTDAAARPSLLSPSSALLKRKLPALVTDTGPPSSAAVSSGHLQPREVFIFAAVWTISSLQFDAGLLCAISSDNGRKPYGAPSVLRRGQAGAPLLKGQKPHIALRSCGRAQMGQMTYVRQKPSIRRSLHATSFFIMKPVQQQWPHSTDFSSPHLSCCFAWYTQEEY